MVAGRHRAQRRADLIPNLVATVKGIAQQEQTFLATSPRPRSALLSAGTPAGKIAANGQLDGALGACWPSSRTIRS